MAKNKSGIFKPDEVSIELGGIKHRLVYDLNAFCEMDAIYGNVDTVLRMLFAANGEEIEHIVTYNDCPVSMNDILVSGVPLAEVIAKSEKPVGAATSKDTQNLVWIGILHDNAIYNADDEVTGYKISKREMSKHITLRNIREVNTAVARSLMNDLVPMEDPEAKNELVLE